MVFKLYTCKNDKINVQGPLLLHRETNHFENFGNGPSPDGEKYNHSIKKIFEKIKTSKNSPKCRKGAITPI